MYIITKKYLINYDNIEYIYPSTPIDDSSLFRIYFTFDQNSLVSYFNTKEDMDKAYKAISNCVFYGNPGTIISAFEK